MALDNYANLKESIQDWSHRADVTSRIDDFILLAEQEMYNNRIEPLTVREQSVLTSVDTNASSRFLALPTGYTQLRRILIDDKSSEATQFELKYRTPEVLVRQQSAGVPCYFTITDQIEFDSVPDQIYNIEIQHVAKALPITAANPTNLILTNYPSIYLAGSLWALYEWAKDGQSSQVAYANFIQAIKGANLANKRGNYGPAPVVSNEGPVV
tara:strand:+ start:981 stop:1616 length:636 start_codon:yes stop_codon:yes gene_type:complete